jgi:hypothetical protein
MGGTKKLGRDLEDTVNGSMHPFQIPSEETWSPVTVRNHTDSQPPLTLEAHSDGLELETLVIIFSSAEDKSQVSVTHSSC